MTRLLRAVTTAACALALVAVPPAHAAESRYEGGCGFDTFSQDTVTGADVYTGVVYAYAVLYNQDHGSVVNATVTCEVVVNGVVQASSSRWGSGVVAFADTVTYTATDTDDVDLCTTVDYTSDDTPHWRTCGFTTEWRFPPQEVIDVLDAIFTWVNAGLVTYVDPAICSAFLLLAPGAGPIAVGKGGDLYVNGEFLYDCAPYEWEAPEPWPPGPPPVPDWAVEPFVPTGGGYNTGDLGFLLLTDRASRDVASTCLFVTDPITGAITVTGTTATDRASAATVHCRLTDTATGAVLYDETVERDAPVARLRDTIPAHAGPVTVCTSGTGTWTDRTVTVGPHCRPGEPLGDQS